METTLNTRKLKNAAAEVAREFELSLVVLFGSHATGHTHRQSDIDIAILAEHPIAIKGLIKIGYDFEQRLHAGTVEIVDLKHAPPLLLKAVATSGKPLYEGDTHIFAEFQIRAMRRYMETKPLRRLEEQALRSYLATV